MGNIRGPFDRIISRMDFAEEEDEQQLHGNFVDRGDLRIWEVLTTTYDHENMFGSSVTPDDVGQRTCRSLLDINSSQLPKNEAETTYSSTSAHSPTQMPQTQWAVINNPENDKSSIKGQYADASAQSAGYQFAPPVTASSDLSQQSFGPLEIAISMPSTEVSVWKLPLYQPPIIQPSTSFVPSNLTVAKKSASPEIPDISYKIFMPMNLEPPFQRESNAKLLLKPLSPYNYYFRDESDSIVRHLMHNIDSLPPPVSEITQERMQSLLFQHWFVDPVKKRRRHRKTHGRISFESLARVIANRWEQITPAVRTFYQMVARLDKKYYQDQLEVIGRKKEAFTRIGE